MKPMKRTIINLIVFVIAYAGVTFVMKHTVDFKILAVLSIVYFIFNYVVYSVLDKVDKN